MEKEHTKFVTCPRQGELGSYIPFLMTISLIAFGMQLSRPSSVMLSRHLRDSLELEPLRSALETPGASRNLQRGLTETLFAV